MEIQVGELFQYYDIPILYQCFSICLFLNLSHTVAILHKLERPTEHLLSSNVCSFRDLFDHRSGLGHVGSRDRTSLLFWSMSHTGKLPGSRAQAEMRGKHRMLSQSWKVYRDLLRNIITLPETNSKRP